MDADKLVEYNPRLLNLTPAARVAYAKFNINKIRHEFEEQEKILEKDRIRGCRNSAIKVGFMDIPLQSVLLLQFQFLILF